MQEASACRHEFHKISEGTESSIAVRCVILPGPADKTLGETLGSEAYAMLKSNPKTSEWVDEGKRTYLVIFEATCPEHPLPQIKGSQTFASVFLELGCAQRCIEDAADPRRSNFTEDEELAFIELSQRARAVVYTDNEKDKWAPKQVGPTSVFCFPPWPWHILHGKTVENRMVNFKTACTLLAKGCSTTSLGASPKYGLWPRDIAMSYSWVTETRKRDPAFSKKRKRHALVL